MGASAKLTHVFECTVKHTHINLLPSPIKSEVFARKLSGYDPILYKSLLSGFREGFKLGFEGEKLQCNFCNAKKAGNAYLWWVVPICLGHCWGMFVGNAFWEIQSL
jgi:hypothetical protein